MEIPELVKLINYLWGALIAYVFWDVKRYRVKIDEMQPYIQFQKELRDDITEMTKTLTQLRIDVATLQERLNNVDH